MSDELELEAIERRIAGLRGREHLHEVEGFNLQRLYLERERIQERQFQKSIERRAYAQEDL